MELGILKILALIDLMLFFVVMLLTKKDKNTMFLRFILLSYPLMSINIYDEITCFDTLCLLFILFFYKRKLTSLKYGMIYTILFLFFLMVLITGLFYAEFGFDFTGLNELFSVLNIFFYSKLLIDECLMYPKLFFKVINYLKVILIFSFVFLIIQFLIGPEFSLSNHQNPNIVSSEGIRYPSFLSDPQVYAQFLGSMGFLTLINEGSVDGFFSGKLKYIIFCLLGILIAGGRAGLLGLFTGFTLLFLFSDWNVRVKFILIAIVLYYLVIIFFSETMIFKRGTDINDAYEFRNGIWNDAIDIFKNNPLIGIGWGNYSNYVSIHNPDQVWLRDNEFVTFDHPESGYLKILTETGLLGFVSLTLFFLIPIIKGIKSCLFRKDYAIILLIAALICWMIGFYSTYSLGETRLKIFVVTILSLLIIRLNLLYTQSLKINVQTI